METRESRGTTLTLPVQVCYVLLYGLSVVAALVQRGYPTLVLGVVASLVPLALLARLPRRWFPGWLRQILQLLLAGCGLAWWRLRLDGQAVDVVLVESATVLGTALAVGGATREYGMMGFISLVLLGYGGLVPGRPAYVPVLCGYLLVGVFLLYETRTLNLAAVRSREAGEVASPKFLANWAYRLAHLGMAAALTVLMVQSFPLPQGHSVGVIPVSFQTSQDLAFPRLWRQWVRPTAELLARGDASTEQTTEAPPKPDQPPVNDRKSAHTVAAKKADPQMDAREGMGGAGVGTDLVMRVQSPAKLYWLAQLYDIYDGNVWRTSAMLRSGGSGLDKHQPRGERAVEQHISIEKAGSLRLPGAFRTTRVTWDKAETELGVGRALGPAFRLSVAGAALLDTPPDDLPWQYRCTSQVPTLDCEADLAGWESFAHRGWNYRRLPDHRISDRLRRLASSLTQDCETPMEKAMKIQEHLRRHYTYTLTPPPTPAEAEPVDYFLMESRQGYCQHFAQAFTVLARLVGLPARLATGYSPGNHNLLSNCFEVYEYHAHAWTQIFIEPYGWLTFDGVAPANLRIDPGPSFLRRLVDPFGEEWSAHPPELSLRALPAKPPVFTEPPTGKVSNPITQLCEDVYARAMLESKSLQPDAGAVVRAAGATMMGRLAAQWARCKAAISTWADHVWAMIMDGMTRTAAFLRSLTIISYAEVAIVVVFLAVLWRRRRFFTSVLSTAWARWRCRQQWRRLERLRDQDPGTVIEAGCALLARIMALGRFTRPANLDALEYAGRLERTDARLGADYRTVADALCRMLYRGVPPTHADSELVLNAVGAIRQQVLARLTLTGARRRAPYGERSTRG